MRSSRPSFPYFFMLTSLLFIFIPPSLRAENQKYAANCNTPSHYFRNVYPRKLVGADVFSKSKGADRYDRSSSTGSPKYILSQPPPPPPPPEVAAPDANEQGIPVVGVNHTKSSAPSPTTHAPPPPFEVSVPAPNIQSYAPTPEPTTTSKPELTTVSAYEPSPTEYYYPSKHKWYKWQLILGIGLAAIFILSSVTICSVKRGYLSCHAILWWKNDAMKDRISAEEMIKNYGSIAPKRYTYADVKKFTNSFKDKVGQGGFGVVYKGKLPDGDERIVAVKVLGKDRGNGEEFINEVASISRTSHVNIVNLLGFCHERTKRALIYEFVHNGSLDKFIYDKGSSSITNCCLDSQAMFRIAIGIARGLEYLHRGCRTRILHFDIKPHNILLDEDLCPKISDFGLAKLCKTKESIVSMTGLRGTAGFIAPEVFSRNFGGVSHKSDVYSYGMLVLEMVGGRKNFESGVSHTSQTYFPHWIYYRLQQGESFVDTFGDITEVEEDTIKKLIIVSLWCIQTNPSDRPSMAKVIEMLENTLLSLQFPPKPFLDSPTRSP